MKRLSIVIVTYNSEKDIFDCVKTIQKYADIPLSELYGYSTNLRSMTGGRGVYSYMFDRYEQAPSDVQERVIAENANEAEE